MKGELNRRGFIHTFAGGLLGGAILYPFPADARAKYILGAQEFISAEDEHFWQFVREQFPLSHDRIFLNNGTMGPSPFVVIDAVRNEMETVDRTARYGGWDSIREKIATFIHAQTEEISITHNVTEGINVIACGMPLKKGDQIILTDQEHVGNALPWLARARRDQLVLRPVTLAETAEETLSRIAALITKRTRVIAVPQVTCTTGQVLPVREICRFARERGIYTLIDAAHTPGMLPLDVKEMDCDFLASCGHKWLMGPKGTGFLYVRRELIDLIEPYWVGGGVDTGWDIYQGTLTFRHDAHKFDFASQSAALYVGLGAAIDFVSHLGIENIARRGQALAGHLRTELEKLGDKITILTPKEVGGFASILSFRLKNMPYDQLQKHLIEKHQIITRGVAESKMFCNRISTHIYNNFDQVNRLVQAIHEVA